MTDQIAKPAGNFHVISMDGRNAKFLTSDGLPYTADAISWAKKNIKPANGCQYAVVQITKRFNTEFKPRLVEANVDGQAFPEQETAPVSAEPVTTPVAIEVEETVPVTEESPPTEAPVATPAVTPLKTVLQAKPKALPPVKPVAPPVVVAIPVAPKPLSAPKPPPPPPRPPPPAAKPVVASGPSPTAAGVPAGSGGIDDIDLA